MSTGLDVDLRIDGFDTGRVWSPLTVTWAIKKIRPVPPRLEVWHTNEPVYDPQTGASSHRERPFGADTSILRLGRRWTDDQRLEMLCLAMPLTVRLEGNGLLTAPPGERMPFGLDVDNDRLRVIVALYLPEARLTGTLRIRPIKAGPFHLTVRRLIATAAGDLTETETLFDTTQDLQDRSPVIIVQDRVTPSRPTQICNSPTETLQLRIFDDHFEIFDVSTGGLVLELFGTEPRFSPTSRFLSYRVDSFLSVVDVPARQIVMTLSTRYDEGVNSLSFVRGDSWLVAGGTSYGKVGVWPILFDIAPEQTFGDLIDWPVAEGGCVGTAHACHACRMHPFEVFWNIDEGCIVVGYPGDLAEPHRHDLLCHGLQGFFVSSLIDRSLIIPHPATLDTPFMRRTMIPQQLGVTYFQKWQSDYELPEDQRVVEAILGAHLTPMPVSLAAESGKPPSLRGQPTLRDLKLSSPTSATRADASALVHALQDFGLMFMAESAPAQHDAGRFSAEDQPVLPGKPRGRLFKNVLAYLDTLHHGVREVLSQAPAYYDECYDSADFGYGLDFAYWLWTDDAGWSLLTVESYNSAGSSGVYTGRICVFRHTRTSAATDLAWRGSLADWGQRYAPDDGAPVHVFGEIERGVYGVGGAPRPMTAFRIGDKTLALIAPTNRIMALIDTERLETIATITDVAGAKSVQSVRLSTDGRLCLQLNGNGRFYLYSVPEQRLLLSGTAVDGEIVLYTDDGFYDCTPDGARYVYRYFAGLGEHHAFSQFASRFRHPELIRAILLGESPPHPPAEIVAPPTVEFDLVPLPPPGLFSARLRVRSDGELTALRLFLDGAPVEQIALTGATAACDRPIDIPGGTHWVTAVAYDRLGFSSIPKSAMATGPATARSPGRLFYVGVAVDLYPNHAGRNLKYAKRDMRLIADTLARHHGAQYSAFDAVTLPDLQASRGAILSALGSVVALTNADDTLVASFAGHGHHAAERFYFLTSQTAPEDVAGTALPWDDVAEVLSLSNARVVVLLDACHSGLASQEAIVPNDAYAAALMRSGKAGMVVLAASKGREFSLEWDGLMGGHGLFSYAVAQALGADRATADLNGNGVIELSELYRHVKRTVVQMSDGTQTPWLSRDEIIGEMPLM